MATSQAEADRLVGLKKSISAHVRWKKVSSRTPRYKLEVTVSCPEPDKPLRLVGNCARITWGFVLLSTSSEPLRKIGVHPGKHHNPDGTVASERHKHTWSERHEGRATYEPDDIDYSNVNQAFRDFLAECNIELKGHYADLMVPKELL